MSMDERSPPNTVNVVVEIVVAAAVAIAESLDFCVEIAETELLPISLLTPR